MNVFFKSALLVLASVSAHPAQAKQIPGREFRYVEGGGAVWLLRESRHGATMRHGSTTIYLSRDCQARSRRFGTGRWGWANGGVVISFPKRTLGFPRYDPPIEGRGGACPAEHLIRH